MKLFKINFTLGKTQKVINKIDCSLEGAWTKILTQYRKAAKIPILVSYELIKDYGEVKLPYTFGQEYEKSCDFLRRVMVFKEEYGIELTENL